jgi:hypothetical protein
MAFRQTGRGKVALYPPVGAETHALLYNFDIDDETLKQHHVSFLERQVIPTLAAGGNVVVTGMCSRSGSIAHNLKLSRQRAKQVVDFLGRRTNIGRVSSSEVTFASQGVGEGAAAVAGLKDGSEEETYRAVYVIVSPKVITKPTPAPTQVPKPPPQPTNTLWRQEELSIRAKVLELPLYKRLNGHLYLTQGYCSHIMWHFTTSALSVTLDPKGKPKVFMGDLEAAGASLWYNEKIYSPGGAWNDKKISLRMNGSSITITIGHALPAPLRADYNPVRQHGVDILGQDLSFTLQQNGGELGVVYGVGVLRSVKYVDGACPRSGLA